MSNPDSITDETTTPWDLFSKVQREFGLTIDSCASNKN